MPKRAPIQTMVRDLCHYGGFLQKELAREVGCAQATINAIYRGASEPRYGLGCRIEDLWRTKQRTIKARRDRKPEGPQNQQFSETSVVKPERIEADKIDSWLGRL